MRRLALAFLVGAAVGLGCSRLSAPPPAPAPARVYASFVIHNTMPEALDIYMKRDGWADILLRRIPAQRTDTIDTYVPEGSAFRLLATSPRDIRYWAETTVIFALSASRYEWLIRTPLHLRVPIRSAGTIDEQTARKAGR